MLLKLQRWKQNNWDKESNVKEANVKQNVSTHNRKVQTEIGGLTENIKAPLVLKSIRSMILRELLYQKDNILLQHT